LIDFETLIETATARRVGKKLLIDWVVSNMITARE
jgi:hypothetical protein